MSFSLVEVERFPKERLPGKLYWSREFEMSGHLCACGCGDFIQLPVGPVDYSITLGRNGPTLRPSVGNWNVCDAHYFITDGEIQWMSKWSPEQIAAGRAAEDARRAAYYAAPPASILQRFLKWLRRLLQYLGLGGGSG